MSHDSCVVSLSFSGRIFDSLFNFEVHSSKTTEQTSSDPVYGMKGEPNRNSAGHGGVAHLGEHLPCKQGVRGSIPLISTTVRKGPKACLRLAP